ncbi:MAG: hypothetical protein Q4B54_13125 [Coriobacteriales bacterium]|nr:hypothetical protein [Coriobacteriales bacterium]
MLNTDCAIKGADAALLKNTLKQTATGLEAVIVARDDMAWSTVRIHTSLARFDISVNLQDLPINDEGDVEEFGVLEVSQACDDEMRLEDVDKDPEWWAIGKRVDTIVLVNSHVVVRENASVIMDRMYTQAIVIGLEDKSYLILDKGAWFSEMITISIDNDWKRHIYDDSQDWEDDPEEPNVHYEWHRSFERI